MLSFKHKFAFYKVAQFLQCTTAVAKCQSKIISLYNTFWYNNLHQVNLIIKIDVLYLRSYQRDEIFTIFIYLDCWVENIGRRRKWYLLTSLWFQQAKENYFLEYLVFFCLWSTLLSLRDFAAPFPGFNKEWFSPFFPWFCPLRWNQTAIIPKSIKW